MNSATTTSPGCSHKPFQSRLSSLKHAKISSFRITLSSLDEMCDGDGAQLRGSMCDVDDVSPARPAWDSPGPARVRCSFPWLWPLPPGPGRVTSCHQHWPHSQVNTRCRPLYFEKKGFVLCVKQGIIGNNITHVMLGNLLQTLSDY